MVYPQARRVSEIRKSIPQRFIGIANWVGSGQRQITVSQTIKSGANYFFTNATSRVARPEIVCSIVVDRKLLEPATR